jgi:antirestriction protein
MDTTIGGSSIDVREVIERVEELRAARDEAAEAGDAAKWDMDEEASEGNEEAEELAALESLLDELRGNGGDEQWEGNWYPLTLIRDEDFEGAMRELVADIGDLPKDIPGYLVIDWEATARNLQAEYSSVDFDGSTYWYR